MPEPLVQGHCTLSFFGGGVERNSEESSMRGVFLLGSYFATQLVDNVENMLDYGEFLNVKHTV